MTFYLNLNDRPGFLKRSKCSRVQGCWAEPITISQIQLERIKGFPTLFAASYPILNNEEVRARINFKALSEWSVTSLSWESFSFMEIYYVCTSMNLWKSVKKVALRLREGVEMKEVRSYWKPSSMGHHKLCHFFENLGKWENPKNGPSDWPKYFFRHQPPLFINSKNSFVTLTLQPNVRICF